MDPGPWLTDHYWTSVEPPVSTALQRYGRRRRPSGGPPRYRMSSDLEESGAAWCRLDGFADDGGCASVRGDATAAYADTLERFVRRLHFRRPALLVVVDDVVVRDVRTQRHLQWLLHTVLPTEVAGEGRLVVRGTRHDLWVSAVLPAGGRWKTLPDRAAPAGSSRPAVHAWALRPPWHHIWNVSPGRSPYPQWDGRGTPGLYGPRYQFAVVLEVTPAGSSPAWTAGLSPDRSILRLSDSHSTATWSVSVPG